jgi:hypothetical protein
MIEIDTNVKECVISLDIPAQTMYLRGYRIEMTDAATSLTKKILYLDIPNIYNGNRMLDTNPSFVYLPVFLDNATVTRTFGMDVPVSMSHHLPERFTVRLLEKSGAVFTPTTGLVSAAFQFYLEKGHL